MQVTPVRPTGSYFQQIRHSLPNCISWARVQGAFSSLAGCFRAKPASLTDRQVAPLEEVFPEGLMEKTCARGILRQILDNRFEFMEHNSAPRYFGNAEAFSAYLKSRVAEISFWRIELGGPDRIFYKYWDEVEGTFESHTTKNTLYHALSKDAGGAFKVVDRSSGTTTYVRNRSGYFTLAFQEFDSEALFLETMQHEKKHRAFLLKCFAGVSAGASVGVGAYAYYSRQQTEERTNAVALPHTQSSTPFRATMPPFTHTLFNITVTEEIPFQSPTWIISDLFGSAMNGAVVSADSLPKGLKLSNQPMSVVNSISKNTGKWVATRKDNFLYFGGIASSVIDVIDISDPLNLFMANRLDLKSTLFDLSITENYSYFLTLAFANYNFKLVISNVSIPLNNKIISTTVISQANIKSASIASSKDFLYVLLSDTSRGVSLMAFDVQTKSAPRLVGQLPKVVVGIEISKIAISSDDCVITTYNNFIYLINATVPSDLKITTTIALSNFAKPHHPPFTATETHLFVAYNKGNYTDYSGTFLIYDITQRKEPRLVSTLILPFTINEGNIVKYNDLCYVSTAGTFLVIDVNDLSNLNLVNSAFSESTESGIDTLIYEDHCFLTDPNGLKITQRGNTVSLYGTPAGGTQGNYTITLTAISKEGKSVRAALNLLIKPAITVEATVPDQLAVIGSNFNFFISPNTFQHVNRNVLTYSADPLPTWLQFNPNSGSFSGSPGPNDAKKIQLQVTAKDGKGATASTQFELRVVYGPKLNEPIGNQIAEIGVLFSFTFPENTFIDKDGNAMEYAASNYGFPLPNWLHFNPSQRTFFGTPLATDAGTIQVVLQAKDPYGLIAETYFQIQAGLPTPLTLLNPIANQIALVGQFFKFYIPTNTFVVPPGMIIHYSAKLRDGSALPTWLTFINQTFSGTPGRGDTGTFSDRVLEVSLKATAGAGISSHVFNINVSGESYTLLVLKVVGPFLSGIGAAYAIYQKRAVLLNCWNKKKYQRAAATAIIGQPFSRSFSAPASHVKAIVARHKGKPLAQNGQLPHGFKYNYRTNALESDHVPDLGAFNILTIQVIGDADKILEQFNLHITHHLEDVLVEAKAQPKKKKNRDYIQMHDLSSGLLKANEEH